MDRFCKTSCSENVIIYKTLHSMHLTMILKIYIKPKHFSDKIVHLFRQ